MRLLILEENVLLCRQLKRAMEQQQYCVDTLANGSDLLDYLSLGHYDGLLWGPGMADRDTPDRLLALRARGISTPILVLAPPGDPRGRASLLDAGADDVLSKPCSTTELLARTRALLRRRKVYVPDVLQLGDLRLDCGTCHLSNAQGRRALLSSRQFQVMEYLMRSPRRFYSGEQLLELVWGWNSDAELTVVWAIIATLRKKLRDLGSPARIRCMRGMGYRIECT